MLLELAANGKKLENAPEIDDREAKLAFNSQIGRASCRERV